MSYPTVPLGKLVTSLRNGLSPSTKGEVPGEVLTLSAVTQGRYDDGYRKEATFDRPPADDQIAKPGMLLICRGNGNINLVGAGVIVPDEARKVVFPDTVIGAQLDSDAIDAHYLRHAWASRAIRSQVEASARTTNGTHKVNQKSLGAIDVPVPPLDEQRRIAAILDKADAIRRKRREAIAMTEELLRSTFLEMFGDPVANPKGWRSVTLSKLTSGNIRNGLSPSSRGTYEGRVLTLSAIARGTSQPVHQKSAMFDADMPPDKCVCANDLLVCRGNGNLGLVDCGRFPDRDRPDTLFPDTVIGVPIDHTKVTKAYLEFTWNAAGVRRQLEKKARTTNGTHKVNQSVLRSIELQLPPMALQEQFSVFQERLGRTRTVMQADDYENLFQSLVQRAFAGHLGAEDAS